MNQQSTINNQQLTIKSGFTIIEILVVTAVLGVVVVSAGGLFLSTIKTNEKAKAMLEAKQAGDNALQVITSKVKEAAEITAPDCAVPGSQTSHLLTIKNSDNTTTTFTCTLQSIQLDSDDLLGDSVRDLKLSIADPNSCFTCYTYDSAPDSVLVSFQLKKGGDDPTRNFTLDFKTSISLRSY